MTKNNKYAIFYWIAAFCIFLSWVVFYEKCFSGKKNKDDVGVINEKAYLDSTTINIDSSSFYAADSNGTLRIIDDIDTFQGINNSSGWPTLVPETITMETYHEALKKEIIALRKQLDSLKIIVLKKFTIGTTPIIDISNGYRDSIKYID